MVGLVYTTSLLGLAGVVLYFSVSVVYNLYFHPLRQFPGPVLHRATQLGYIYRLLRGSLPLDVVRFHEKYGPVVRVGPNELAFSSPEAWKDIYGHKTGSTQGMEEMSKAKMFYRNPGMPPSLISEDRENHAVLRRLMSHGFSERSMREQEPIIGGYVNLLVRQLRKHCVDVDGKDEETGAVRRNKLDMTSWYNWTTFDIIGDLAFGEPFGCLDRAKYHPWVALIAQNIHSSVVMLSAKMLGLGNLLVPVLAHAMKAQKDHRANTRAKLIRRMEMGQERPDFVEGLIKRKDEWGMSLDTLQVNASLLIIAGSETTATLLSGLTYLLLTNPKALERLTAEVRSSFKSDQDITLLSVNSLEYMQACLNEALRRYPPVPMGMPRQVPKGGATIAGTVVPEGTVVAVWHRAVYHLSDHFREPFSFRPERWMRDPLFQNDRLDVVQPFSVGPRNCLGKK
jgi:cytochrome P450